MRILMPHDAFCAIDDLSDCRNILGKIPTKAANVTNKQIALDNCNQRIQKTFQNLSGVYPKMQRINVLSRYRFFRIITKTYHNYIELN